jgi:DNA polymerase III sliding clamp (beta) subunit (PCNA family)
MLIEKSNVSGFKNSLKTVYSVLKGSDVLVVLDLGGGLLYGQDSDLDIALAADYLKAGDTDNLRLRVDAKKLHAILTHARGDIQLSTLPDKRLLRLVFGSSQFELPTTAAPAPPMKAFKNPQAVPATALVPVINQALTVAAVGAYSSILVTAVVGVGLRAVATDGLRLIVATQAGEPAATPQLSAGLLISQRAAEAICKLPGDTFHIFTDETSLVIDTGTARMVARKTSAKFPEYEKVIPVNIKREYTVKAEEMLSSLDMLSSVLDDPQANVLITLTNDSAKLDVTGGSNTLPVTGKTYDPNFDSDFDVLEDRFCFRHSFLTTFFNLCKGDVVIKIEDTTRPVLFENGPLKFVMASGPVPSQRG